MTQPSKYKLKDESNMVCIHRFEPITKSNITDSVVESIVRHNAAAASHFLNIDGSPLDVEAILKPKAIVVTGDVKADEIKVIDNQEQPKSEAATPLETEVEHKPTTSNATTGAIAYAGSKGIDLSLVKGTMEGGRISKEDVKAFEKAQ